MVLIILRKNNVQISDKHNLDGEKAVYVGKGSFIINGEANDN